MALENKAAPSGAQFTAYLFDIAQQLCAAGFIRWSHEPIKLKSGIESHIYVFGREDLTDNPLLLRRIGDLIAAHVMRSAEMRHDRRLICLIGIPTAGTPLATAASLSRNAVYPEPRIISRVMREERKDHGAHKSWVNGKPEPHKHAYWTLDNVITDGESKLETIDRLAHDGYPVAEINHLVLVDRQQGGIARLKAEQVRVEAIFSLLDLVWAFGELGLWPKARLDAVEAEIRAHQFA